MSKTAEAAQHKDRRLTLPEVVDGLVADGLVPADVAQQFKQERRYFRGDIHPLVVIAEQRWKSSQPPHRTLDLEQLSEWLAHWSGLDYMHIDPLKINFAAVTEVMSNAYATRFRILPVEVRPHEVVIATAEPYQRGWESELEPILRKSIRRVIANPDDIARYQVEFYNLAKSVKRAMAKGDVSGVGISSFEQLVELGKNKAQLDANDQHVVLIVDWLWQYAFEQRASDIHVEPRRDIGVVRFRIDGVLHQVYQIPMPVLNAMTSRIKILGRMDVVEKRRPQDGRIKTRMPSGQEIELRLATLPTAFGEKLVMRIFDPEVLVRDFAELGFGDEDLARWRQMTSQPHGIILVTGPTGSGKTTTLYSTLRELATPEVNVCTLEDPIEMIEPAFNQVQVVTDIGMTFAEGIRALMRQDPDIIMVGEIRDLDTAENAIQAALTGHLVFSTLHTNDAPSAIVRLLDLGVPPYLIKATVIGVVAQRLVRTLCKHCKQPVALDPQRWKELLRGWPLEAPEQVYEPHGCLECRETGFLGRAGIYEILRLRPPVRALIDDKADLAALREAAIKDGMLPLRIAGEIGRAHV
jgi:general secretion pathway protein E